MSRFISAVKRFELIISRGSKCEYCGWAEYPAILDVHHIKPLKQGGKSISKNFKVLCPNCHKTVHNNYATIPIETLLFRAKQAGSARFKRWRNGHREIWNNYHNNQEKIRYRRNKKK